MFDFINRQWFIQLIIEVIISLIIEEIICIPLSYFFKQGNIKKLLFAKSHNFSTFSHTF